MSSQQNIDKILSYKQDYQSRLERLLRQRGRNNNLIYYLGLWLNIALRSNLQNGIREKRRAIIMATHFLSLALLGFAIIFYYGFAWFFLP